MIDPQWAQAFAQDWIESWNAHDMERILSHYTDEFEMSSPLIVERLAVFVGVEAITLYYNNVGRRIVVEPYSSTIQARLLKVWRNGL